VRGQHSLAIDDFERIKRSLSLRRIASSIASHVLAPIGRSCGANQHRTPLFCKIERLPLPTVPHYELLSPFPPAPTLRPPRYTARQDHNAPENQEEWYEALWQWLVAFYKKSIDEPVAVFTLVLAVSTIFLWRVTNTNRNANAARDAAEALPAIERPYVLVTGGGSLTVAAQMTRAPRPAVFYRAGNYGRTPAIIENVRAGYSRNNRGNPDMPPRVEETHPLSFTRTLKADQEFQYLWVFYPEDWTISSAIRPNIRKSWNAPLNHPF
jgi:hypothetical protein